MQTLTFVWLALSGWLFRIFIFSTFVLPFAAPLLLGTFANRVAIEVNDHLSKFSISFSTYLNHFKGSLQQSLCDWVWLTGCCCFIRMVFVLIVRT
uniref:Uncharacterized protein n=1 Tax=Aegilops tauschii subsp. strangulata TaxID=200361 RepID=A0A452YUN5_AEGTS